MTLKELLQTEGKSGQRLRQTGLELSLTQEKLATLAGTNQAVIQKIENGRVRHPRIVDGLAMALEVNPAWLQWGSPYASVQVSDNARSPWRLFIRISAISPFIGPTGLTGHSKYGTDRWRGFS